MWPRFGPTPAQRAALCMDIVATEEEKLAGIWSPEPSIILTVSEFLVVESTLLTSPKRRARSGMVIKQGDGGPSP